MQNIIKIFLPSLIAFVVGIIITPLLTQYFYKYKLWKRTSRIKDNPDEMSKEFEKIHNEKTETGTPRVGGTIIWGSVLLTIILIYILKITVGGEVFGKLDFLSRNQTLLPLIALIFGGVFGLFEDFIEIFTDKFSLMKQGLPSRYLIGIVILISFIASLWFFNKLGMRDIYVPFVGYWHVGIWFIPIFIIVTLGTFSSRVIDGIDGLAGGVMAIIFGSFGVIAFMQNQIDIATFCFVITGGILAFLWFNIPPARFYMGETGMLGLTLSLSSIIFLIDGVFLLPIIGALLVATSFSSAIQIYSKRYFHKKIFRVAPLHHHFQALGWSREKITMRYWILTGMFAVIGIIIALIG
jgi:phospho-N-acetylmuramoyl-pentapeptide-transferase